MAFLFLKSLGKGAGRRAGRRFRLLDCRMLLFRMTRGLELRIHRFAEQSARKCLIHAFFSSAFLSRCPGPKLSRSLRMSAAIRCSLSTHVEPLWRSSQSFARHACM
jgi:hypothetical protein